MSGSDLLVSVVYIVYISAAAFKDEIWLRGMLLLSSLGFAAWGVMLDSWPVVGANVLFVVLSARAINRLVRERRPYELATDLEHVRDSLFPRMTAREFQTFWDLGEDVDHFSGPVTTLGEPVDYLSALVDGTVEIEFADGNRVARQAPTLIGDVSFAAGGDRRASATATGQNLRLRRWSQETLRGLEDSHPTLVAPFLLALSSELTKKVGFAGT